ncbi:hypothetical protein [Kitasatospora sp. NPDC088351]|uniref:hypothetical protein n=1 Tax=Kitasatospora sp. NPDC088351 TaxID=3155180 RepID=UPI003414C4BC
MNRADSSGVRACRRIISNLLAPGSLMSVAFTAGAGLLLGRSTAPLLSKPVAGLLGAAQTSVLDSATIGCPRAGGGVGGIHRAVSPGASGSDLVSPCVSGRSAACLNRRMIDWSTFHDAYGPADAIPVLLERAADRDQEAIDGLWGRLCHQGTVSAASIAALPRLADIAKTAVFGDWALDLAGAIAGGLLQSHVADEEVARYAPALAQLRDTAAARLGPGRDGRTYLGLLKAMLAFDGQPLWFETLDDFTDSFFTITCPHCGASVTIAVGDYGCYSSIRDWDLGDVHQVPLRPATAHELSGVGRMLHELAVRDGRTRLAWGLTYLFGRAECPGCKSVFGIAEEYEAVNAPISWDFARSYTKDTS